MKKVEVTLEIHTTPETVIEAFTDPVMLGVWWESSLEIDNFTYLNPGISILGPMTLTVQAKKKRSGAELYVCQDGYQTGRDWDWYYEAFQQAWPLVANRLKEYWRKIFSDIPGAGGGFQTRFSQS